MPIGILFIFSILIFMPTFNSNSELENLIRGYFNSLQNEFQLTKDNPADSPANTSKKSTPKEQHNPALLTGLALHIGFASMAEFEQYEHKGKYKKTLKAGRLMVQQEYELKLHQSAPTGAMFALRCMGWADKPAAEPGSNLSKKLKIEVITSGPAIVTTEKDVTL